MARIAPNSCPTGCTNGGRLDVSFDSGVTWYSVCDDFFTDVDAAVACRTMGYTGGTVIAAYNVDDGPYAFGMDDVGCSGSESSIFTCPYISRYSHNCVKGEEVGVQCTSSSSPPPSSPPPRSPPPSPPPSSPPPQSPPPSLSSCDASKAPTNGKVGTCTSSLARGSTCQPTCNSGYTVSGVTSCSSAGKLTSASCGKNCKTKAPANGSAGTCKSSLARGSTCQPTCKTGYTVSGVTSCSSSGKLTSASCRKK